MNGFLYPVMVKQINSICVFTPANSQFEANINVMKGLSDGSLVLDTKKCVSIYEVSDISLSNLMDDASEKS